MAGTLFSSSPSMVAVFSCLFFLMSYSEAGREILVGNKSDSWKIPPRPDYFNKWAQNSRFIIGDTLVWKYDGSKDSVLQVNKRDYVTCNTSSPIAAYRDGDTKVKLNESGPHYFISGAVDHCEYGQKMIVVVLSEEHSRIVPSPAPSPVQQEFQSPAMPPVSRASSLAGGCSLIGMLMVGLIAGIISSGLF
ncbi:OLC1v1030392C1 [Oldenlandia corymbosa var. corymbosa]|uniref:OLC1v1030392C1 n=1 Tax=Oldenlandia corymbosa var. corymbosa TaxID=529605 RepID=A0AAV1CGZ8_OLDCO|nr:OLC1v1030392C1 [Oldenlandia corymbosa var. corymbosa]